MPNEVFGRKMLYMQRKQICNMYPDVFKLNITTKNKIPLSLLGNRLILTRPCRSSGT